ncbi:MAG TPA: hypothetical protein VEK79_20865 [Thermoanaerobaculia bacterium]|nr:hypothetical protein [Thermoanaerobaculia bacterium]
MPVEMLVTYIPKPGKEQEIERMVLAHWPVLASVELVTDEPATIWRAVDKRTGQVSFVERFSWKDEEAAGIAHQMPQVMALWEPMGPMLEELKLATIQRIEAARA